MYNKGMKVRKYDSRDKNFILNSFLKSFVIPRLSTLDSAPQILRMDGDTVVKYWHDRMGRALEEGGCTVANPDDDDLYILGYLVREENTLFYVYTRELARRRGVASGLVAESGFDVKNGNTVLTNDGIRNLLTHLRGYACD